MSYLRTSDLAKAVGANPIRCAAMWIAASCRLSSAARPAIAASPSAISTVCASRAGYSTAAILRMLIQLDRGETTDLRRALDTPRPDEDARLASDRWISTLAEQGRRAHTIIALIGEMIQKQARENR